MSKGIYVGKLTSVPIYGTEVTSIPYNLENFENFFYKEITNSNAVISLTENGESVHLQASSGRQGKIQLTALYDLSNVEIKYHYYSSTYALTIKLNGTTQSISPTGFTASSTATLSSITSLKQGDVLEITLTYVSSSSYCPYVMIKCNDLSIENTTITGYEEKEIARKVNTLYAGVESNVPIYEDSLTELNVENVSHFFTVAQGTQAGWGYDSNENNGLITKFILLLYTI